MASIDGVLNPVIKKNFALNTVQNANPLQILIPVVSVIWLVGMGCMLFYMIMSFVTAGMLCIVIALCFLTNPAPKYLLKGIKAQDITSIKVFDGNNGQEFIIEEPKEIVEIVENFQSTPMKREKSSIGYMGYRFRMTFTDKEGKEIEQFILNQKNTIREDPFFYTSEQPLCYDYIEQLEQKYLLLHG